MPRPLAWEHDGPTWPLHAASRFVSAAGVRWHVQMLGQGPVLLLLHGTGASTHSWRALAPRLAPHARVLSVDLPGHGFSTALPDRQMSLPGMAAALGGLVQALGLQVAWVLGHSAGAALGAQMLLDGRLAARGLLALNGALLPLGGLAGWLFPPAARLLAAVPGVPRLVARRATDLRAVRALIQGTGSELDVDGLALYARLMQDPQHVQGLLAMMAHWDLPTFADRLPTLAVPVALLAGARDRAVPAAQAQRVLALLRRSPAAGLSMLHNAGHLAHEEQPTAVADWVLQQMAAMPGPAQCLLPDRDCQSKLTHNA